LRFIFPNRCTWLDNLPPIIFHLFRQYPHSKFIVIGDYKIEVLRRYLSEFAEVDYTLVSARNHSGTCAGIGEALTHVPDGERLLIIWCDLVLGKDHRFPDTADNVVGVSKDFVCRWSFFEDAGEFREVKSDRQGVAGYFLFRDKSELSQIPADGEFVRFLKEQRIKFSAQPLFHTKEYGLYSEWLKLPQMRCRPFNRLQVKNGRVIEEGIDAQGKELAVKEIAWYKKLRGENFKNIPTIYEYEPLTMEFINGKNIYEYTYLLADKKREILSQIIACLRQVHALGEVRADRQNYYDAYLGKTYRRLERVRRLVPFADDKSVTVNGRACRNIFYCQDEVERLVMKYLPEKFCLIHGDCTFSNTMLRYDTEPVLIDPRGYFGNMQFFGDPAYDWVKLYYSLVGNYDQFNLKRFSLEINERDAVLTVDSNRWEELEKDFFELLKDEAELRQMKILLSLIWLSLTTYAWDDYDSICGAFYNGLWYLEDAFSQ